MSEREKNGDQIKGVVGGRERYGGRGGSDDAGSTDPSSSSAPSPPSLSSLSLSESIPTLLACAPRPPRPAVGATALHSPIPRPLSSPAAASPTAAAGVGAQRIDGLGMSLDNRWLENQIKIESASLKKRFGTESLQLAGQGVVASDSARLTQLESRLSHTPLTARLDFVSESRPS